MSKNVFDEAHLSALAPLFNPDSAKLEEAIADSLTNLIYGAIKQDTVTSPTTEISLFGLTTEAKVRTFIHSPAGDTLFTNLASQVSLERTYLDNKIKAVEQEILIKLIKSSYYKWEMENKVHDFGQKDLILLLNQQAINRAKPVTADEKRSVPVANLYQTIANYQDALNLNMALLHKNSLESDELQALEQDLLNQEKLITAQYALLTMQLEAFENKLNSLSPSELDELISDTRNSLEQQLKEISAKIENKEDVTELLQAHQILQLQLFSHENFILVNQGNKYYADEEGREVNSLDKAHYILDTYQGQSEYEHLAAENRKSRIIKKDDVFYLLKPGESWDSIKDDLTAKNAAKTNYELSKSNLLTVKNVLKLSFGTEIQNNKEQVTKVVDHKVRNQEAQALLHNQSLVLEAALASAQNSLNNPTLNLTPPMPTVSGNVPKSTTVAYRNTLKSEIQLKPQSEDQLAFRDQIANYTGPYSERFKLELRLLPMNAPIPPLMMARMLQTMETYGVSATKPSVTSIKGPLELELAETPAPTNSTTPLFHPQPKPMSKDEDEEELAAKAHQTPTPFSDPYK